MVYYVNEPLCHKLVAIAIGGFLWFIDITLISWDRASTTLLLLMNKMHSE